MKLTIKNENIVPITIIHLEGVLDGSNFEGLIAEGQKLHGSGVCDLILDLGKLTFISSAGLSALHQVALMFLGKKPAETEGSWADYRWAAFHATERPQTHTPHAHVKLLSPTMEVMEVLEMIGFRSLFEIYTDLDQAIASYHQHADVIEVRPL